MAIQWRTDYSIRLLYEAARMGQGCRASVRVLADNAAVPYEYARQIARDLARAGLLISVRGAGGGTTLGRPASEITVLDIFEACGEAPTLSLCTHAEHVCGRTENCPVHHNMWLPLDSMIEDYLRGMTLQDVVDRGIELEQKGA